MTRQAPPRLTVPVGGRDHVEGPSEAVITLVEYGDFECPYCGMAYPIVEELRRRIGDGMRFVFRHFPLNQTHPHAEIAAEAAEAAGEQSRFWEMHRTLYTHQNALDLVHLLHYALQLGLDADRFEKALKARRFEPRVHDDFMSGARSGVNGTPTFFINGVRYDGPMDLPALLETLEAELESAGNRH